MNRIPLYGAAAWLLAMSGAALQAAPKKPVYVGVRVCAGCHTAAGIGSQYGKWLHSKHSAAYAVLAKPEGLEMAKLSGLRTLPQDAAICLGCHATAWHSEEWEKDETFHIEDGVQCEGCHGPGSEYASLEVMKDRQAAMKAGLRMPDQDYCVNCHIEKGSHVAVVETAAAGREERLGNSAPPAAGESRPRTHSRPDPGRCEGQGAEIRRRDGVRQVPPRTGPRATSGASGA